jgi:hypothetical protein
MQRVFLKKKKRDRLYSMRPGGGVNRASVQVYLETQETSSNVYQNFRLVCSELKFLTYFTDSRFIGYNKLESAMDKHYAGNGNDIIFRKKVYFNNLITVIFDKADKNAKVREEIRNVQFRVEAPIPATQGCISCEHFRKSNKLCIYYQTLGIKTRKNCSDFRQKEVYHGRRENKNVHIGNI